MDSATSTASQYGHIGLFSVGKAWKRRVEGMVGGKVEPKNYLRAYNVTGAVHFGGGWTQGPNGWTALPWHEVRAVIRLTAKQAMMMKLRHGGSGEAWVQADPTGENWGNLLVGQHHRQLGYHRFDSFEWRACSAMKALLQGDGFGPALSTVANHGEGLEPGMKRAFVWNHAAEWHEAAGPVDTVALGHAQSKHQRELFGPLSWQVDASAWSMPAETTGARWAQDFWRQCQNAEYRRRHGVSGSPETDIAVTNALADLAVPFEGL